MPSQTECEQILGEIGGVKEQLDEHLVHYNNTVEIIKEVQATVESHLTESKAKDFEAEQRHQFLVNSQERSQSTQAEAMVKLDHLNESTKDLVDAWQSAEGAIRVGATVGRFVKWASGFAALAGILHWLGVHVPK